MSRVRAHHADEQAAIIERLIGVVDALMRAVEVLMRASAVSIVRAAEVEARDLLTVQQAAHEAGDFSPSAVRKWGKQGKIKTIKIGGRRYVIASTLPPPRWLGRL